MTCALVPVTKSFARGRGEYLILVCDEEHVTTTEVVGMLHRATFRIGDLSTLDPVQIAGRQAVRRSRGNAGVGSESRVVW